MRNVSTTVDGNATLLVSPEPEVGACEEERARPARQISVNGRKGPRIWIDLDNSPHVPFFRPIIEELRDCGFDLMITARDMYQTRELVRFFDIKNCKVIGSHYGKHTLAKVFCNCSRALQLLPICLRQRPQLAISHGSRAQVLVSKLLRIPTLMIHDYEFSTKTGWIQPDWTLMPDVIPSDRMSKDSRRVLKYPGLKEDVYVPRFAPDPSIQMQLGLNPEKIIVTVRPPACDSHYHTVETENLFIATVGYLSTIDKVQFVVLPRNAKQKVALQERWSSLINSGQMVIPGGAVDGLNVMWFSDLVISSGGTMNREAAALGIPVYSIFRGKIGAVDEFLAKEGRLQLVNNSDDLRSQVKLVKWPRPATPDVVNRPALSAIVRRIVNIANGDDDASVASSKNRVNAFESTGRTGD